MELVTTVYIITGYIVLALISAFVTEYVDNKKEEEQ